MRCGTRSCRTIPHRDRRVVPFGRRSARPASGTAVLPRRSKPVLAAAFAAVAAVLLAGLAVAVVGLAALPSVAAAAEQPLAVPAFAPSGARQAAVEQRLRDVSLLSAGDARAAAASGGKRDGASSTAGPWSAAGASTAPGLSSKVSPRLWSVLGEVLDFHGAAIPGADVGMDVYDSSELVWSGSAQSDAAGQFVLSGSPTGTADIFVELPAGAAATGYQAWGIPLADGSTWGVGFRPGLAPSSSSRTSRAGWNDWTTASVQTYGSLGGADTDLGASGAAHVMPPDYGYACVYYYYNQGVEWNQDSPDSYPVSSGGWGSTGISVDQDDAQSVLVLSRWASGKPGTKIRVGLGGWPAGYVADVYGYSEDPNDERLQDFSDVESPGGSWGYSVSLRVPGTAKPGYAYVIKAARADQASDLVVHDYFQVCSLRSSRSVVRRGGAIRLSGVIPTQGHWGSQTGHRKTVTVYARTRSAGQPSTWNPGKGWKKVGTCKANGLGKYLSKKLRPRRTTWYVVRYPGDGWYWRGFTSVVKVRVK